MMLAAAVSLLVAMSAQSAQASTQPEALATPARVLSTPDWADYRIYPKAALRKDEEGRVLAEIVIGTDGIPKACRIIESSNFPELDNGTCELFMKMRFEPARSAAGVPVESRYERSFEWRLTDPLPFAPGALTLRAHLESGRLKGCEVEAVQGPYADLWSRTGCSFVGDASYFFAGTSNASADAVVQVTLNPQNTPLSTPVTPIAGTPVAVERIEFEINGSGDPVNCKAVEQHGFGTRGLNNLSPCSRFLSSLWFRVPRGVPRQGTIETRVYILPN